MATGDAIPEAQDFADVRHEVGAHLTDDGEPTQEFEVESLWSKMFGRLEHNRGAYGTPGPSLDVGVYDSISRDESVISLYWRADAGYDGPLWATPDEARAFAVHILSACQEAKERNKR